MSAAAGGSSPEGAAPHARGASGGGSGEGAGLLALWQSLTKSRRPGPAKAAPTHDAAPQRSMHRMAAIAQGGAVDHAGRVTFVQDPDFDLNVTIFKEVRGIARMKAQRQLSFVPVWTDEAADEILREDAAVPAPPLVDRALSEFMQNRCNFLVEHADGSFMDHLTFCHDYCVAHYSEQSPRVMLLHSIMGVGTNIFPMEASKIPELASLISPDEMRHVESFPSVLRLLVCQSLCDELWRNGESLRRLRSVEFRRVIDNKELVLDAEDFWAQLNYQLVHLVDFVPVADWAGGDPTPLFQVFLRLYRLLSRAGQLRARVELRTAAGKRLTADEVEACARASDSGLMAFIQRLGAKNTVSTFSKAVGHSLEYKVNWAAGL